MTWRTGRKVGRTIYDGDTLIGMMDTPALAEQVVAAVNAMAHITTLMGAPAPESQPTPTPSRRKVRERIDGQQEPPPPLIPWEQVGQYIAGGNGPKRTKLAAIIASGELESVKIGRRRFVPREAVEDYVRRLTS